MLKSKELSDAMRSKEIAQNNGSFREVSYFQPIMAMRNNS